MTWHEIFKVSSVRIIKTDFLYRLSFTFDLGEMIQSSQTYVTVRVTKYLKFFISNIIINFEKLLTHALHYSQHNRRIITFKRCLKTGNFIEIFILFSRYLIMLDKEIQSFICVQACCYVDGRPSDHIV